MPQMLVLELANNPGDALSVALAGSPTGYRSWLSAMGTGVRDDYVAVDSTGQYEWGVGYPTAGTPNTFTRETVLGGTLGAGKRVPFIGQVEIYSDLVLRGGMLSSSIVPVRPGHRLALLTTTRAIPNATQTIVEFDSTEYNDLPDSTSLSASRIVVPNSGRYLLRAQVFWAANSTGARRAEIISTDTAGGTVFVHAVREVPASGESGMDIGGEASIGTPRHFLLRLTQASGAALNIQVPTGLSVTRQ